jgi:hypothetical protein
MTKTMKNYRNLFIRNTQFILNDITKDTDKINNIVNELTLIIDDYEEECNIVKYNTCLKELLIKRKYFSPYIINFIIKYLSHTR